MGISHSPEVRLVFYDRRDSIVWPSFYSFFLWDIRDVYFLSVTLVENEIKLFVGEEERYQIILGQLS